MTTARPTRAVVAFLHAESTGGLLLLAATAVALVWANSPWHAAYSSLWHTDVRLALGDMTIGGDLRHWINDGLMALFFFVIGLEIKREIVTGELRRWKTAALPVSAAVGGMLLPALLYLIWNRGGPGADGWAIPMATDIAFALGLLTLLGDRVHPALKLFVLTLAVADDIGAIVVIAFFYTTGMETTWLLVATTLVLAAAGLYRCNVRSLGVYILLSLGVWLAVRESGVHATIAGVVLGLLTPARPTAPDAVVRSWAQALLEEPAPDDFSQLRAVAKTGESMAERLQRALHPWTSFVVVPLFALANAGIRLADTELSSGAPRHVAAGVVVGLVVGKFAGILGGAWLGVRLRFAELPTGLGWRELAGGAACAGIGFTVSLFIADLAFGDSVLGGAARAAVLGASAAAALLGAGLVSWAAARPGRA